MGSCLFQAKVRAIDASQVSISVTLAEHAGVSNINEMKREIVLRPAYSQHLTHMDYLFFEEFRLFLCRPNLFQSRSARGRR